MAWAGYVLKRKLFHFISLLLLANWVKGQKIQYCRETFPIDDGSGTQLVANVDGNHHVVVLNSKKPPQIYVFDRSLRLTRRVEIDFKFSRSCGVKVLPFRNFYYVYIHPEKSNQHNLWRVYGEGNIEELSQKFQQFIDTAFGRTNGMLQLFSEGDFMYAVGHTYFENDHSVESTIARFDRSFRQVGLYKVEWNFSLEQESLEQVTLWHQNLIVVKKSKEPATAEDLLQIMKINSANGESTTTSFRIFLKQFLFAEVHLDEADSSAFVYGVIDETPGQIWLTKEFFFAKLDSSLRQEIPPRFSKSKYTRDACTNFIFVDGQNPFWIQMQTTRSSFPEFISTEKGKRERMDVNYRVDLHNACDPENISTQISSLDNRLEVKADTLIKDKYSLTLESYLTAQTRLVNKNYLVLLQLINSKRRTMLLIGSETEGGFQTINVPVNDTYEYQLSELRTVDKSYFVVPYIDKDQMGLLKVTMRDDSNRTPDD